MPSSQVVDNAALQATLSSLTTDWPTIVIRDIGNLYGGLTGKSAEDFGNGDASYVTFLNVFENVILDRTKVGQVRVRSGESQNCVHRGDILFNGTSETPSELAMACVVDVELDRLYLNSFCFGLQLTRPDLIDPYFLAYLFRSRVGRDKMASLAQGATRYNLSKAQFRSLSLPCPPLIEQHAIVEALSDVDALIDTLDKLIAKKRSIKQGTMQLLLAGKQRLPGFDGEWETRRLDALVAIISGGTPSTSVAANWDGGIGWCTPTDITRHTGKYLSRTERTISRMGLEHSSAQLLPKGSLLLCTRATIGEVRIAFNQVSTNQGFKSLVVNEQINNEFLYYLLLTMKSALIEKGTGSTFLEVSRRDIAALPIHLPPLVEQRAIATVLSDMDAEIDALLARRHKTKLIRQGMMQELLTGRTRLV